MSLGKDQEYTAAECRPDFGQKPVFGSSNAATVTHLPSGAAAASVLRTMQGGTRWFCGGRGFWEVYLDSGWGELGWLVD